MPQPSIRSRSAAVAAVVAIVIATAACSSSDGDSLSDSGAVVTDSPATTGPVVTDPPATDPAATDPVVTDPPATDPATTDAATTGPAATDSPATDESLLRDLSYLWGDVDEMVREWERANTLEPDGVARLELSVDDFAVAPLQSAGEGFASTDAFTAGRLSGTIDPGGEVSAIVVTIFPDDDESGALLETELGALGLTWANLQIDSEQFTSAVADAYGELLAEGPVVGEQRFVRGPEGLTYVAVLTVIDDASAGEPAIEVAVIPVPDEEIARSVVELLRVELMAVTG